MHRREFLKALGAGVAGVIVLRPSAISSGVNSRADDDVGDVGKVASQNVAPDDAEIFISQMLVRPECQIPVYTVRNCNKEGTEGGEEATLKGVRG